VQLKTLEWARGLAASLRLEVDTLASAGVTHARDLERIVTLRQGLKQAEALVKALEEHFAEGFEVKDVET
jgi:hypothetical protein